MIVYKILIKLPASSKYVILWLLLTNCFLGVGPCGGGIPCIWCPVWPAQNMTQRLGLTHL